MSLIKIYLRVLLLGTILTALFTIGASAACLGVGTINTEALRLRAEPSVEGSILATATEGECVVILEQVDEDWYRVDYRSVEGYMSTAYLDVTDQADVELGYGVVLPSALNVRTGPGTKYACVTSLSNRTVVEIHGVDNGWFKVSYGDIEGYVSGAYLELCKDDSGNRGDGPIYDPTLGSQIVEYAAQFIGTPYVWGGNGPKSFDCSGLTKYVYAHFGYDINRTARDQAHNGVKVSWDELQPGDLIFFHTVERSYYITHVGLYAGNGQIIHASSGHHQVEYADLYSDYFTRAFVCARRIID